MSYSGCVFSWHANICEMWSPGGLFIWSSIRGEMKSGNLVKHTPQIGRNPAYWNRSSRFCNECKLFIPRAVWSSQTGICTYKNTIPGILEKCWSFLLTWQISVPNDSRDFGSVHFSEICLCFPTVQVAPRTDTRNSDHNKSFTHNYHHHSSLPANDSGNDRFNKSPCNNICSNSVHDNSTSNNQSHRCRLWNRW